MKTKKEIMEKYKLKYHDMQFIMSFGRFRELFRMVNKKMAIISDEKEKLFDDRLRFFQNGRLYRI